VVLAVLAWIAVGGVMSAVSGRPAPRGRLVDIGGRRLRIVCEGQSGEGPDVVFEAGAFGLAADWAEVQRRLALQGVRSCAYDRAGLGYSDPGPSPRDGLAIERDLQRLLAAAGERPPFVLVGHSMAGLHLRLFAGLNPGRVAGLVLVDADTPEESETRPAKATLAGFTVVSRLAAFSATFGALKPLAFLGDTIGLPAHAAAEKRWAFTSAGHNRTGAAEVDLWTRTAEQAKAAGQLDPSLPVVAVTADHHSADEQSLLTAHARAARRGEAWNVPSASHATLLGSVHAAEIVRAIEFVRAASEEEAGAHALASTVVFRPRG
jgi:pimeloyl-ACP methyl ester carboxylesterase